MMRKERLENIKARLASARLGQGSAWRGVQDRLEALEALAFLAWDAELLGEFGMAEAWDQEFERVK